MSARDITYAPNAKKVVLQIRDTLLGDFGRDFADVVLRTLDRDEIPACRALLALRSNFFKRLFYSNFSENNATTVFIAVSSKLLRQVIEFAYTGDSTLVSSIRALIESGWQRRRATPDACRKHISDLIDLGIAADYCDMHELSRWCMETLRFLVKLAPKTICLVLERLEIHPAATDIVSREGLVKCISKSPADYLLVPDVANTNPFEWRNNRLEESPESSPEHAAEEFGVLQLSSRTLETLVAQLIHMKQDHHAKGQHEYLFQVIYFWATNGRAVQKGDSPNISASETDIDRWDHAKKLVAVLDIKAMKPVFVRDFVDPSGLVGREVILEAYRYHATKNCDIESKKVPVKNDSIIITKPGTKKATKAKRRLALLSELPEFHIFRQRAEYRTFLKKARSTR